MLSSLILLSACSSADSSKAGQSDVTAATTQTTAPTPQEEEEEPVTSVSIGHKTPEEYGKVIALTFDDGPNTTTTGEVLDLFEKYGVRGTFFLIGDNIDEQSAENVKRAYQMGCEIANHSKTHSYMNKMTEEEIKAEIDYTSDKIEEITGERPKFFRPPYIAVNQTMLDAIDLTFINGFGCTDYEEKVDAEARYKKTMEQAEDGAIILLHDAKGNYQTVQALEKIIPDLLEQGYELVTVSELFFAKGVLLDPDDGKVYSNALQETWF